MANPQYLPLIGAADGPTVVSMPTNPPSFDKKKHYDYYKRRMDMVKLAALAYAALQATVWFLGACNLTWASAVILGGLLSSLSESDYYSVTVLLVAEALRLGLAYTVARLVISRLPDLPTDPNHLVYDPKSTSGIRIVNRTKYAAQSLLLLLISACFFLSLRRLRSLHRYPSLDFSYSHSLRIFYILVLLNTFISAFTIAFSDTVAVFLANSFSLRRWFDYVAWSAMEQGLLSQNSFELDAHAFGFKLLSDEFRRNVRPPTVYATYRDLIDFLYSHPHMKGFEAAAAAMESEDVYIREAAANAAGSWAMLEEEYGGVAMMLQRRLLASLAEALDHNETGRAASYALEIMARKSPTIAASLTRLRVNEVPLVEILILRVKEAVEFGKPDKAIIFVKALVHLLPECAATLSGSLSDQLKGDLNSIFDGEMSLVRSVAVAAKALSVMGGGAMSRDRILKRLTVKKGQIIKKQHLLKEEMGFICDVLGDQNQSSVKTQLGWIPVGEAATAKGSGSMVEIRDVRSQRVGQLSYLPDLIFLTLAFAVAVAACVVVDRFVDF